MKQNATFQRLAEDAGIHFPGPMDFIPEGVSHNFGVAMDAQPGLITVSSSGIPSYLANYIDPKIVEVLTAPMKAALIVGEAKKGDWTTVTATFPAIESTGEVSSYGDYNTNGSVGVNANFNQRESYHYQTITKWGEKELEMAGLAKIDWASRLNIASALVLNKYQNQTYFFGVAGLRNFGLLNDPALTASIAPSGAIWSTATADVIYEDIRRIFVQLQIQANGTIDQNEKLVLAMSPTLSVTLNKTNQYNVNVYDQVKKNFPNIRFEFAPEYATVGGQLVQMIVESLDGQDTATCAFTEKMRAHAIVRDTSSFLQKKSQGTFGTVIFRPAMIASLIGA
jgi:hypothetical protein